MLNKQYISFISFFCLILLIIQASIFATEAQDINDYFIYQDGYEQKVPVYNGVINLQREPFSIRFYNKKYNWDAKQPYVVKLSVLRDKSKWKKIETGKKVEDSLFFQGGSAFAVTQDENYNALFFSDSDKAFIGGSHHLRYGEGKDDLRTAPIIKTDGVYDKMEFKIDAFFIANKIVKISDSNLSVLYFVALNDKNLNGIIDEDDLIKFVIRFE